MGSSVALETLSAGRESVLELFVVSFDALGEGGVCRMGLLRRFLWVLFLRTLGLQNSAEFDSYVKNAFLLTFKKD